MLHTWGWHSMGTWRANFAVGAVLSATEPAAAMATFAELDVSKQRPWLVALVFGESMINNGLSILYVSAINKVAQPDAEKLVVEMISLFLGSMLVGVLAGVSFALPMQMAKFTGEPSSEVFYVMLCPYLIYAAADAVGLSGTIACVFAGVVFKVFSSVIFPESGLQATGHFMETCARLAEGLLFIICGASAAFTEFKHVSYCFIGLLLCVLSRIAVVVVCGSATNAMKLCWGSEESKRISWKESVIVGLSGTRGGIALFLSMWVGDWCSEDDKHQIITAAFFIVCFLLLLSGSLTGPCLKYFELVKPKGAAKPDGHWPLSGIGVEGS